MRTIDVFFCTSNWALDSFFPDKEKMVKILLDAKPDMIEVKNINGTTPLIVAADNGMKKKENGDLKTKT